MMQRVVAACGLLVALSRAFDLDAMADVYDDGLFEAQFADSFGAQPVEDKRQVEVDVDHLALLQTNFKLTADVPVEPDAALDEQYSGAEGRPASLEGPMEAQSIKVAS
eukprot:TRINITY_DN10390_c0_g1_i1.p1 TRINITY_DN10390_c0_g1~~TRINITY_DN10390_c0_g1_i1.p1  ORF type:complete len:108 (+),score=33.31 TRINITY_DN10390_c0_g1_i1:172-495(+)